MSVDRKLNNAEVFCMAKLTENLESIDLLKCVGCDGRDQNCSPRKGEIRKMEDILNEIETLLYFSQRLIYNETNKGLEKNSSDYEFLYIGE